MTVHSAGLVSLILAALLVVALAVTLLWVLAILVRATRILGDVAGAVGLIAERTEPIGPIMAQTNRHVQDVADALTAATGVDTSPVRTSGT